MVVGRICGGVATLRQHSAPPQWACAACASPCLPPTRPPSHVSAAVEYVFAWHGVCHIRSRVLAEALLQKSDVGWQGMVNSARDCSPMPVLFAILGVRVGQCGTRRR
eukprot:961908-Lingulodinium_polyedra.AAC.1